MRNSDLIVPHGVQNDIAIQFIVENLKNKLLSRGVLVRTPKEEKAKMKFTIMFEIVDDVLIQYQSYSKQIYSIKDQFKDEEEKKDEEFN